MSDLLSLNANGLAALGRLGGSRSREDAFGPKWLPEWSPVNRLRPIVGPGMPEAPSSGRRGRGFCFFFGLALLGG